MKIVKTLWFLSMAFVLSGCVRDMDPFEGGDGVRVNINGEKCVMYGIPGGYYATLDVANDVSTFKSEITMMSSIVDAHINYIIPEMSTIDRTAFMLGFNIAENDIFVKEKKYEIKTSGDKKASMTVSSLNTDTGSSEEVIKLKGWAYFLSLGNVVEVRFELDGKDSNGKEYALRHGFLRLHQKQPQQ